MVGFMPQTRIKATNYWAINLSSFNIMHIANNLIVFSAIHLRLLFVTCAPKLVTY